MLKDVGITVPKNRETSVVYMQGMRAVSMQQDRGESSIYAARQGLIGVSAPSLHRESMTL